MDGKLPVNRELLNLPFDEKGIGKVRKKYSISKDATPFSDTVFHEQHYIFIDSSTKKNYTVIVAHYVFRQDNNQILVIGFRISNERDLEVERVFARAVLENSIPSDVYIKMEVDTIKFAGRDIVLGPVCAWRDVHNIQCAYRGQMNWAEFRSLEKAERMIK